MIRTTGVLSKATSPTENDFGIVGEVPLESTKFMVKVGIWNDFDSIGDEVAVDELNVVLFLALTCWLDCETVALVQHLHNHLTATAPNVSHNHLGLAVGIDEA